MTLGAASLVNRSLAAVALDPLGVVTVTSTVPAGPAGELAASSVAELTVKVVAAGVPKWTAVVPVNAEPVMTTLAPPARSPAAGTILVTAGAGS